MLIIKLSTSESYNDSETENLQLRTIHETYSSVIEKSLSISFFDPSFFKYPSNFIDFLSPRDIPLNIATILKNQEKDPILKIVYNWIKDKSCPDV